ncbi:MAG: hypothetical protein KBT04_08075 [Bacteroidales bacterium]|nr:hypothetical protein [Candidatus Colimorpha onthohippi]
MKKTIHIVLFLALLCTATQNIKAYNPLDSDSRFSFSFLMGWDGLGETPFEGLRTMPNAYSTRPWLNSWQIEVGYDILRKDNLRVFAGIGYESDVFLFDWPFVDVDYTNYEPATLVGFDYYSTYDDGTYVLEENDYYESRLVTRYITIPIGFDYTFDGGFTCGATIVTGVNYTTSNTGLKYSVNGFDQLNWRVDMTDYTRPVKCDLRINAGTRNIRFFVQLPLTPLFVNLDRTIYPLKFGFMLKY